MQQHNIIMDINHIDSIISHILQSGKKLLYVAGSSASGKSYVASLLAKNLKEKGKKVLEISSDSYYTNDTGIRFMLYGTFDHPDLIEYSLLDKNIHELIQKGSADIPEYSFKERRRVETHRVEGQYDFIIVEGLYTIAKLSFDLDPLKIFVSADLEELIMRRLVRDQKRVAEPLYMIVEMLGKVFPMWNVFGQPQKKQADIIIDNNYEILEQEGEVFEYKKIDNVNLDEIGELHETQYHVDYIYNDISHRNGEIVVTEVYYQQGGLLDGVILTKRKRTSDAEGRMIKSISMSLYQPGILTGLHALLQTAGLTLVKIVNKKEKIYHNHTKHVIIEEEGGHVYLKQDCLNIK